MFTGFQTAVSEFFANGSTATGFGLEGSSDLVTAFGDIIEGVADTFSEVSTSIVDAFNAA